MVFITEQNVVRILAVIAIGALMLLVGRQEEHPARKSN